MKENRFGGLFDLDLSEVSKKTDVKKKVQKQKQVEPELVKRRTKKITIDTIDTMCPYTINVFTKKSKPLSCNFYKHEQGGYVTDDPYTFNLRKKFEYEIVKDDLCETIDQCPNNFPNCSICKFRKKHNKR